MKFNSSSFFHFTNSKEALFGILNDGLRISYCNEKIRCQNKTIEVLIPMVSFCKIPVSGIKLHIMKYGKFGIGLKEKWGLLNNLCPIWYLEKDSQLALNLYNFISVTFGKTSFDKLDVRTRNHLDFIRYIKNYKDDLLRKNHEPIPNYLFVEEQEWRYCPLHENIPPFIDSKSAKFYGKAYFNEIVSSYKLSFSINDISYIFVENESDISDVFQLLSEPIFKKVNTEHDLDILKSRILTFQQIKDDF